jgi:hypothetical protein
VANHTSFQGKEVNFGSWSDCLGLKFCGFSLLVVLGKIDPRTLYMLGM